MVFRWLGLKRGYDGPERRAQPDLSFLKWTAGLVFAAGITWAHFSDVRKKVEEHDTAISAIRADMAYLRGGMDRLLARFDR